MVGNVKPKRPDFYLPACNFSQWNSSRMGPTATAALTLVLVVCFWFAAPASAQQFGWADRSQPLLSDSGPYLTEGHRNVVADVQQYLDREVPRVQESIGMLPNYTAFDNIEFVVDPGNHEITLYGQVTNPALASSAGNAVKDTPGVAQVINQLEVLPNLKIDMRLQQEAFRAIYDTPQLSRYREQQNPPVHIVVQAGSITLIGWVSTEQDRAAAYNETVNLPGVTFVRNELVVDPYAARQHPTGTKTAAQPPASSK